MVPFTFNFLKDQGYFSAVFMVRTCLSSHSYQQFGKMYLSEQRWNICPFLPTWALQNLKTNKMTFIKYLIASLFPEMKPKLLTKLTYPQS